MRLMDGHVTPVLPPFKEPTSQMREPLSAYGLTAGFLERRAKPNQVSVAIDVCPLT